MARQQNSWFGRYILAGSMVMLLAGPAAACPEPAASGNNEPGVESNCSIDNETGGIEGDVEIEGATVINGKVYIDGERVPKGKRRVVSRKTGKVYLIHWGANDNVTVTEK